MIAQFIKAFLFLSLSLSLKVSYIVISTFCCWATVCFASTLSCKSAQHKQMPCTVQQGHKAPQLMDTAKCSLLVCSAFSQSSHLGIIDFRLFTCHYSQSKSCEHEYMLLVNKTIRLQTQLGPTIISGNILHSFYREVVFIEALIKSGGKKWAKKSKEHHRSHPVRPGFICKEKVFHVQTHICGLKTSGGITFHGGLDPLICFWAGAAETTVLKPIPATTHRASKPSQANHSLCYGTKMRAGGLNTKTIKSSTAEDTRLGCCSKFSCGESQVPGTRIIFVAIFIPSTKINKVWRQGSAWY